MKRAKAKKGSEGKKTGDAQRPLVLVLLFLTVALFAVGGVVQGPKIARIVWSELGVRHVEHHTEVFKKVGAETGIDPALLAQHTLKMIFRVESFTAVVSTHGIVSLERASNTHSETGVLE